MKKLFRNVAVILSILGVYGCSDRSKGNDSADLAVKVNNVESKIIQQVEEFPFISKPFRISELSFRVGGPLHKFDVVSGNHYKKGDVIAEIDPRDFKIRLERAESKYYQAKSEFERIETLYKMDNLSASAYDKAKAEYTAASTAYVSAKNELTDTQLIAPFDGYIGEVYMEKYQDVRASQPIISFVELDKLRIEAYVPQHIVGQVKNQDYVEIVFDALPGENRKAVMLDVSKNTTKNNLSYLITTTFDNKDNAILAGMSGKMIFHRNNHIDKTIPVVPQIALCHRPSIGDYVWVINPENQMVERRVVKTGEMLSDGTVEINEGIKVGEKIAVTGLRFLSDEKKVSIINNNASTESKLVTTISTNK